MGFWNEGAGERSARAYTEGVQANEEQRQSNRLRLQNRHQTHAIAIAEWRHKQAEHRQWAEANRKWQLKEYDRECRAADREERESKYRTPDDVAPLAGEPKVPAEPELVMPEPAKLPMGLGTFGIIVAVILIGWSLMGDFVVTAYEILVFAVPVSLVIWAVIFHKKQNEAGGDPERLAALDRWNPYLFALRAVRWSAVAFWKLFKLGIK